MVLISFSCHLSFTVSLFLFRFQSNSSQAAREWSRSDFNANGFGAVASTSDRNKQMPRNLYDEGNLCHLNLI